MKKVKWLPKGSHLRIVFWTGDGRSIAVTAVYMASVGSVGCREILSAKERFRENKYSHQGQSI